MPRRPQDCPAGTCFHVINRALARLALFEKESDYEALDRVLALAYSRVPLPIYSYIVMPNHWHFVVQPQTDTVTPLDGEGDCFIMHKLTYFGLKQATETLLEY